jgi:hypothetical protein
MDRSNHYEAAFEAYLRRRRLCYVAVNESRRSLLDEEPVKSLDFIVYGPGDARLLVDVKGRQFPGVVDGKPRYAWECWAEDADVSGLGRWVERFGPGYVGLLAFTYMLAPEVELPEGTEDLWEFRGRRYLLRAVAVDNFARHMRVRSPKWATVDLPRAAFRDVVRPFCAFTDADVGQPIS